jgi:ribosomal protein S18 acetylase RimI-like enzyme
MDGETPHIDVRSVNVNDTPALCALEYDFETDCIYTLHIDNHLIQDSNTPEASNRPALTFALLETQVDPPIYKNYREPEMSQAAVEARLAKAQGGFVALADGSVAGGITLNIERERRVVHIQDIIVGRQFRRYGIGSLLLSCAADWARNHKCWAIVLETQNINYPAIQLYLRNGLEVWSMNPNFYPPGPFGHEVAIFMGKRLTSASE